MSVERALRTAARHAVTPPAVRIPPSLLDVAYATVDSPVGALLVASTRQGRVRIGFPTADHDAMLDDLAARLSPRVIESADRLDKVRRQLDEYFAGRRHDFTVPLDWALSHGFRQRV